MITHLEPDTLECEVKWALGNITANKVSGGDGIPAELFQILILISHAFRGTLWETNSFLPHSIQNVPSPKAILKVYQNSGCILRLAVHYAESVN